MKTYSIQMEVSGPTAMWTRPDTGDSPVSYPVPTWSAVKGLFEAIVRVETVDIVPTDIEICAPIVYHNYATNYGGPLRKSRIMGKGASYQLLATVLINVCYRLHAEVRVSKAMRNLSDAAHAQKNKGCNVLHSCQDMFNRRLAKGQWFDTPFLGWREFVPSYMGPFREETKVQEDISLALPSFLFSMFDESGVSKMPAPVFKQDVKVVNGRLSYAQ